MRACVVALVKGFVSNHCATVVQVTNHHFVINKYVQTTVLGTECVPRMASVHVTVDLVVMTVRSHRAAILSAMDTENAKWDVATARTTTLVLDVLMIERSKLLPRFSTRQKFVTSSTVATDVVNVNQRLNHAFATRDFMGMNVRKKDASRDVVDVAHATTTASVSARRDMQVNIVAKSLARMIVMDVATALTVPASVVLAGKVLDAIVVPVLIIVIQWEFAKQEFVHV